MFRQAQRRRGNVQTSYGRNTGKKDERDHFTGTCKRCRRTLEYNGDAVLTRYGDFCRGCHDHIEKVQRIMDAAFFLAFNERYERWVKVRYGL